MEEELCRNCGTNSGDPLPLFAYGSLRRGQRHADRMRGARWIGEGWVRGRVVTHAGYPALVPGQEMVAGELWDVSAQHWAELDTFEDAYGQDDPRSVYVRLSMEVHTATGAVPAWVYALHSRSWPLSGASSPTAPGPG